MHWGTTREKTRQTGQLHSLFGNQPARGYVV